MNTVNLIKKKIGRSNYFVVLCQISGCDQPANTEHKIDQAVFKVCSGCRKKLGTLSKKKDAIKAEYVRLVKDALATDPEWARRGLMAIYNRQTQEEKRKDTTETVNGIGFTRPDAKKMSYWARLLTRGMTLFPEVMIELHERMPKYAVQLSNITPLPDMVRVIKDRGGNIDDESSKLFWPQASGTGRV